MINNKFILGAGMTGLAAGYSTGLPIFETKSYPGGICSSYYVRPFTETKLESAPSDDEAYRFEIGGGHWIFGGDERTIDFIKDFSPLKKYERRSSVCFHRDKLYVPYPIQNNLRFLSSDIVKKALGEICENHKEIPHTMKQWLEINFGATLCEIFFFPFNSLYTAEFYDRIAPQDAYKSPVDINLVKKGAENQPASVGYNSTFLYPEGGLDTLARRIAEKCLIQYNRHIIHIDINKKELLFENHKSVFYDKLVSTLPLNETLYLCGLTVPHHEDPHTSVLVLNVGAERGDKCPDDHWLYNLKTDSGFHRVGFYSNVDRSFIPLSSRLKGDRVSIYVERAYESGRMPSSEEIKKYSNNVIKELQAWGFINRVEVLKSNWIDVAYTWSWPDSQWKMLAIAELERFGILQVGRYGRWNFQGIADSIRDGIVIGSKMK
jgi:protoporphyrinogen oxidase